MATSGSIKKDVTGQGHYIFTLKWVLNEQNTVSNKSNVTFTLTLTTSGGSYHITSSASKTFTLNLNGTTYTGTGSVNIGANTTIPLMTKTVDIPHNSDGSKTFSYGFSSTFGINLSGTIYGTQSASGNGTLPSIPKLSPITSVSSATIGGNYPTVKWTPASASYYYKLRITCGSWYKVLTVGKPGQTTEFTFSTDALIPESVANQITTATSATATCGLYTYTNSTYETCLGHTTKNFTLNVPSSMVPKVSFEITDSKGYFGKYGVYINGYSKVKATLTETISYGSSIKSRSISVNNQVGTTNPFTSSVLSVLKGTNYVSIYVKDSRGRKSSTVKKPFKVEDYYKPSLLMNAKRYSYTNNKYVRSDEGDYMRINCKYFYSSVNSKNTAKITIKYNVKNSSTIKTIEETCSNPGEEQSYYSSFIKIGTDDVYEIEATIADKFLSSYSSTVKYTLPSAFTLIDFHNAGTGIRLGGVATEEKTFASALKIHAEKGIISDSPGYINYTGETVSLASSNTWAEIAELPSFESGGVFHWDIVLRFPKNATGNRGASILYSEDGGVTKSDMGIGWMDVSPGNNDYYSFCRISGNSPMNGRKLYIRAFQTSGETMDVTCRWAYYRLV